jgi:hypothetical protein
VNRYVLLLGLGAGLVVVAAVIGGGRAAAIGGLAALAAQLGAVALLRPAMRAPQPLFMARWFGGMGLRALALGAVLAIAATHRAALPPLPAALGFLGVLLPLLFLETRFLR